MEEFDISFFEDEKAILGNIFFFSDYLTIEYEENTKFIKLLYDNISSVKYNEGYLTIRDSQNNEFKMNTNEKKVYNNLAKVVNKSSNYSLLQAIIIAVIVSIITSFIVVAIFLGLET